MRLLDLFCGAGGAAMGYHWAGFDDITGVDINYQPRYPFQFVRGDALEFLWLHGSEFDAIHASPPCQAYSRSTAWRGDRSCHPDLIGTTREALERTGVSYVIENVQEARGLLHFPTMLCGSMFGLRIQRHRYFELSGVPLILTPPCQHRSSDYSHDHGKKQSERVYADAMGCDWMTAHEARQAIPPLYTEFLGKRIVEQLLKRPRLRICDVG